MNFLIVDDDRNICNGTARRIRTIQDPIIGKVECAYSGEEALERLGEERFQVLFTDIRMGDMDGLQLVAAARKRQPSLVCVIITAFDQFQYAQKAIRLGVFDFLVKPCSERAMREQAVAAARHALALNEQMRDSLNLALSIQTMRGEKTLRACFEEHGMDLPQGKICMAVFRGTFPEAPWKSGWYYLPKGQHFLLFLAQEEGLPEELLRFCRQTGECLGISLPGNDLKTLLAQAEEALSFAWLGEGGHAVCYVPQRLEGMQEAIERIRQSVSGGVLPQELSALCHKLRPERMAYCTELMKAACESCGIPAELKPGMGWHRAIDGLHDNLPAEDNDQLIRQIKAYARAHLYDQIDMAMVANQMNLSYSYFSRIFHESTGKTFSRYLLELRMEEVCRLLMKGERLVDIAQRLGYQNASNLTRSFTREFGMAPSQWLEKQSSKENGTGA